MKKVVYTVIFGCYDKLYEPDFPKNGIEYICFTDDPLLASRFWDVRFVDSTASVDKFLLNRIYKFFPFQFFEADISLYLDGNIRILRDPTEIFEKYLSSNDIAAPRHSIRNCVYSEIDACVSQGLLSDQSALKLKNILTESNYPVSHGLYENNVLLRNHNSSKLQLVMSDWFDLYKNIARRDQLSLCYCLFKHNLNIDTLQEGPRYTKRFFEIRPHSHHLNLPLLKRIKFFLMINSGRNSFYTMLNKLIDFVYSK